MTLTAPIQFSIKDSFNFIETTSSVSSLKQHKSDVPGIEHSAGSLQFPAPTIESNTPSN